MYDEVYRGTLTYDNQFRPPHDPVGPAVVDCSETGRVGVVRGTSLALPEGLRVDGTISVRIVVDKGTLLENSFSLSGCPSPASGQVAEELPKPSLLCEIGILTDTDRFKEPANCW